jgi:hypothetical protein
VRGLQRDEQRHGGRRRRRRARVNAGHARLGAGTMVHVQRRAREPTHDQEDGNEPHAGPQPSAKAGRRQETPPRECMHHECHRVAAPRPCPCLGDERRLRGDE